MTDRRKWIGGTIAAIAVLGIVVAVLVAGRKDTAGDQDENVIKIGAILPLTGGAADIGESSRKGMELCIDDWNKKGGVLNQRIESVLLDSKGEPKEGRMLTNKLLAESGSDPLLVYTLISGVALNVKAILEEEKILHLACIGSSNLLEEPYDHTLRNYISPKTLGPEIIDVLVGNFNKKDIIVFYINNELGLSYKNSVVAAAAQKSVSVKGAIPYEDSHTDYRNVILTAKINSDDILYVAGVGASIGRMIKQIRESGFAGTILCDANLLNGSATTIAGKALKGVFVLDFHRGEQRDEFKALARRYEEKYGSSIDIFALLAYQGIDLVLRFVEENKVTDFQDLAALMEGCRIDGIMGEIYVRENEIIYPLKLSEAVQPD